MCGEASERGGKNQQKISKKRERSQKEKKKKKGKTSLESGKRDHET